MKTASFTYCIHFLLLRNILGQDQLETTLTSSQFCSQKSKQAELSSLRKQDFMELESRCLPGWALYLEMNPSPSPRMSLRAELAFCDWVPISWAFSQHSQLLKAAHIPSHTAHFTLKPPWCFESLASATSLRKLLSKSSRSDEPPPGNSPFGK